MDLNLRDGTHHEALEEEKLDPEAFVDGIGQSTMPPDRAVPETQQAARR